MIVYDLICSQGHHFEGWFENLQDLENQMTRQLLSCPACGDEIVVRRPSTFGVVKKTSRPRAPAPSAPDSPAPQLNQAQTRQFIKQWRELSELVEKDFDDVGPRFTDEALKIHYGASDRRNIRGQSSEDQEKMLRNEGVEFFKMPLLSRKNSTSNEN